MMGLTPMRRCLCSLIKAAMLCLSKARWSFSEGLASSGIVLCRFCSMKCLTAACISFSALGSGAWGLLLSVANYCIMILSLAACVLTFRSSIDFSTLQSLSCCWCLAALFRSLDALSRVFCWILECRASFSRLSYRSLVIVASWVAILFQACSRSPGYVRGVAVVAAATEWLIEGPFG